MTDLSKMSDADLMAAYQQARGATPVAKLSPDDAAALKGMTEELSQKQLVAQRAAQFMRAQGTGKNAVATGPGFGDIPIISSIVPNAVRAVQSVVDPKGSRQINDLDAISGKTWELLRPKGSGPIRGYEAQGLKAGFPNASNWGDTNAKLAADLQQEYQDHLKQTQFVQNFVRSGHGSVGDALTAFQSQGAAPAPVAPRAAATQMMQQRSAQSRQARAIRIDASGNIIQ